MMPGAPRLPNEAERLSELRALDVLDSPPEMRYDAITFLASQICDVPIALVTLVDESRQWFKSRTGFDAAETHRDLAFCAYAIHNPDAVMVVPDTSLDERFVDNPLVTGDPNIRFYAGAPILGPGGHPLGTLCVLDRKPRTMTSDQEKALRALAVQVAVLLELRHATRELGNREKDLEDAASQRDSFMAAVSHELRTPLTAVIGYVELLREEMPDELRMEMLQTVARQASDVDSLLEDLLVTARAEVNSLRVASVSVNLVAQVAQAMEGIDSAHHSGISLTTVPARATGDPSRVRQIIRNLITNAIRYGGPSITVSTFQATGTSHLTVADNGPGIAEEDQQRIFEPFGQAHDSPYVASSVGLGLPISRVLAERMGGTLTYRYDGGHSIFELTLPVDPTSQAV